MDIYRVVIFKPHLPSSEKALALATTLSCHVDALPGSVVDIDSMII